MSGFLRLGLLNALGCFCLNLLGCNRPPPPPTVADLQFPVLVVYPSAGFSTFENADNLKTMRLQKLLMSRDTAALIDSKLRVFLLENLKSNKNGMSIWISGGRGPTAVTFDLVATKESGLAAAREWICKGTSRFTEGPSAAECWSRLEAATTFAELVAVVNEGP